MENKYDYIKTAEQAIAACLALHAEREARHHEEKTARFKRLIAQGIDPETYIDEGYHP